MYFFPGGGGVLPIMAYTGRLRPKGVPFSGFRCIKGLGLHKFRYMKGQENLRSGINKSFDLKQIKQTQLMTVSF